MIHVQIASDITASGVEGVRWVLLEPSDPPAPAASVPQTPSPPVAGQPEAPAPALAPAPESALRVVLAPAGAKMRLPMAGLPQPARIGLRTQAWQLGLSGLGLAAVMSLAQRELGPAALPWLSAAAAPAATVQATLPTAPARPAPVAVAAAPVAPAPVATAPVATVAGSAPATAVPLAASEPPGPAAQPMPDSLVPALPAPASSTSPRERLTTVGP